jgi:hypothetical protein
VANTITQLGITPDELDKPLAIEDEAWQVTHKEWELRGEQGGSNKEKPEERIEQPEGMGEA